MSANEKVQEAQKHIHDLDARLRDLDRHIKEAREREEQFRHPAVGLDFKLGKPEPSGPGQFGG
jgi:hypothetical protein